MATGIARGSDDEYCSAYGSWTGTDQTRHYYLSTWIPKAQVWVQTCQTCRHINGTDLAREIAGLSDPKPRRSFLAWLDDLVRRIPT